MLYREWIDVTGIKNRLQLVVPDQLKHDILHYYHDVPPPSSSYLPPSSSYLLLLLPLVFILLPACRHSSRNREFTTKHSKNEQLMNKTLKEHGKRD